MSEPGNSVPVLRVAAIGAAVAALVAAGAATASSAYRPGPTNACLAKHHVLLTPHKTAWANSIGMPVTSIESIVFMGYPIGVLDTGTLLFAKNAAGAHAAAQAYFAYYLAYDVKQHHGTRKQIAASLNAMDEVIGNVFVPWNNFPQSAGARRVLKNCLR
jgi:hypothetical protein